MRNKQYLPKPVFAAVQKEVEKIAKEVNGIKAIVIATVDGFDIVSTSLDDTDPKRIAAMASSISAISHVVAQEAGLGYGKNIIINTTNGFIVVQNVKFQDYEIVINIVAKDSAILGQVSYYATRLAEVLISTCRPAPYNAQSRPTKP